MDMFRNDIITINITQNKVGIPIKTAITTFTYYHNGKR